MMLSVPSHGRSCAQYRQYDAPIFCLRVRLAKLATKAGTAPLPNSQWPG